MKCYTLHSNGKLIEGIASHRIYPDGERPAYEISVGSHAPCGEIESYIIPATEKIQAYPFGGNLYELRVVHPQNPNHLVLIKNQSPSKGAWSLLRGDHVETFAQGYMPTIRNVSQGEGAEYLLEMPKGSQVKIALAGAAQGRPKLFYLFSEDHMIYHLPRTVENSYPVPDQLNYISGSSKD